MARSRPRAPSLGRPGLGTDRRHGSHGGDPVCAGRPRSRVAVRGGIHLPWWALALAFAAAELFVVHVNLRGSALSLSLVRAAADPRPAARHPPELCSRSRRPGARAAARPRALADEARLQPRPVRARPRALSITVFTRWRRRSARGRPRGCGSRRFAAVAAGTLAAGGAARRSARSRSPRSRSPSRQLRDDAGRRPRGARPTRASASPAPPSCSPTPRSGWLLLAPGDPAASPTAPTCPSARKHRSLEFLYGVARSVSPRADLAPR